MTGQTAEATVVDLPAMARAYRSGRRARRIILEELRQRQGGEAPSLTELAAATELHVETVRYHLKVLADRGWLEMSPGEARSVKITPIGLEAIDTV